MLLLKLVQQRGLHKVAAYLSWSGWVSSPPVHCISCSLHSYCLDYRPKLCIWNWRVLYHSTFCILFYIQSSLLYICSLRLSLLWAIWRPGVQLHSTYFTNRYRSTSDWLFCDDSLLCRSYSNHRVHWRCIKRSVCNLPRHYLYTHCTACIHRHQTKLNPVG